jgi:hypothetical protein
MFACYTSALRCTIIQQYVAITVIRVRQRHIPNLNPSWINSGSPDHLARAIRIEPHTGSDWGHGDFIIKAAIQFDSTSVPRSPRLLPIVQSRGGDPKVPPTCFIFRVKSGCAFVEPQA